MKAKYVGHLNLGGYFDDTLMFYFGECKVLLSGAKEREQQGWHFSISHPSRNPTWEEQRDVRYELIPDDVYMVSVLPPKSQYVNIHARCFHWHEAGPKFFDPMTGRPKA